MAVLVVVELPVLIVVEPVELGTVNVKAGIVKLPVVTIAGIECECPGSVIVIVPATLLEALDTVIPVVAD